jgi:aminopeptidase N
MITMTTTTTSSEDKAKGRVLLPICVVPVRYDLTLTPNLQSFTFDGIVEIVLTTTDGVGNEITLHAKELMFKSAKYVVKGDEAKAAPVDCQEVSAMIFTETVSSNGLYLLLMTITRLNLTSL